MSMFWWIPVPSWFDFVNYPLVYPSTDAEMENFDMAYAIDQSSVLDTSSYFLNVIDREISILGSDASKVFIGGESQGCMTSLAVLTRYSGA
jgi:predicted esterase